jgi:hypothetical protein
VVLIYYQCLKMLYQTLIIKNPKFKAGLTCSPERLVRTAPCITVTHSSTGLSCFLCLSSQLTNRS